LNRSFLFLIASFVLLLFSFHVAEAQTYTGTQGDCGGSNYWQISYVSTPEQINYTGTLQLSYSNITGSYWIFRGFPQDSLVLVNNGQNIGAAARFTPYPSPYQWTPPANLPLGSTITIMVGYTCGSAQNLPGTVLPIGTQTSSFLPNLVNVYASFMGGPIYFLGAIILSIAASIYARTRSAGFIAVLLMVVLPLVAAMIPNEVKVFVYLAMVMGWAAILYQLIRRSGVGH